MRSLKSSRAITLIALIVTIIVLLILAGIGITMLTGENSIIKKSIGAKDASSEAEAKEKVELEVLGSLDNKGNLITEKFKNSLRDNLGVQEHQIQEQDDGALEFPLGDYDIEVDPSGNVEALKNGEIPTPPQLEDRDITFTVDPSKLTNKEVKVSIKANIKTMRLTLQYALKNPDEENSWQTYTGPVTMKDNGPIYARLINENGEKSNYTTGNVSNIDRELPTIISFTAKQETATSSTVEVTVEANDDRELAEKNTYKFFAKEEGPATISAEENAIAEGYTLNGTSEEGTYTYKGLTQGKNYTLKVIVTDEAGNTAEETTTVNTTTVPSLEEPSQEPEESPDPSASPSVPQTPKLTFKYEPSTWNNKEQATVTLQLSEELQSAGYNLQYSLDNDDWKTYESKGFTITENGSIYARLIDDNNQTGGVATSNYSFFDRKAPGLTLKVGEKTQNEITLNVTASDTPSGLAEGSPVSYYVIEGRVADLVTAQSKKGEAKESSENKTYTYTELKTGTVYTLLVEVKDKAGNKTAKMLTTSTENIPGTTTKPTTEGTDTDNNGKIDSWDTNGDGQIDAKDTTGDGNADTWLKDPTNPSSGWTDKKDQNPQPKDTNKDGLPDTWVDQKTGEIVSEDTDNDGYADKFKDPATGEMKESKDQDPMPQDTTGNGLPDTWVDKETGEVVAQDTKKEPDGKANQFVDENGNLTDKDEGGKTLKDTDGDGIPDARVDEEGNVENKENPKEPDSPWVPDESGKDTDGDGVVDQYDQEKYPEGTKKTWDTDGDGEDDAADTTGDGKADQWKKEDGTWSDKNEQDQKQWDTNGDGIPDAKDTTGDDNADEWLTDPTNPESGWSNKSDEKLKPEDTNGDGLPDQWKDPEQGDKVVAKDNGEPKTGNATEFVDPKTGEFPASGSTETYPKPEDTNGDGLADTWKDEKGNVVAKDTKEEPDGKANEFADPATGKMPEKDPEKPTPETYPKPEDTTGDGLPDTWKDEDGKVVAKDTTVPPDGKADSFVDPVNPDNGWTDYSNENVKPEDKDGDGLPDRWVDENGEEIARDNNGDGKADEFKNESGDFSNKDEQGNTLLDTNGDGIPDTRVDEEGNVERKEDPKDPDSAWEKDETGKDTNKDGIIDEFNPEKYPEDTKKLWDTDGDGVPDARDTTGDDNADEWLKDPKDPESGWTDKKDQNPQPEDTNGDGLPDQWKDPEQGDKVVAKDEKEEPDGKANKFDNGDGELTDKDADGKTLVDTDGDGIPDAKVDEEGNVERKEEPKDPESPWVPDNRGTDENKDGIIDKYDDDQYPKGTTKVWDTDGDGKDDAADTDGDGNADKWKDPKTEEWKDTDSEGNKQWDTDGDGIPDARDTDDDDRADEWLKDPSKPSGGTSETDENGNKYVDTDNDGKPDAKVDPDSGDIKEVIDPETGEWGKPEEVKGKPTDTDKDSIIDTWDLNGDEKPDAWDKVEPKTGKPDTWDTDFNDKEDAWDKNNDGKPDAWDTDGDGQPDVWDTNGDGQPDAYDTDNSGGADEWEFPAEEGSITFTDKPDTWTNTQVEVTLKSDYTKQGYTIEYSKDYNPLKRTGNWETGETATLDQNGTLYTRLKKNGTEETGGLLSHKVTNIDKTNPTVTTSISNVTTNSATLNVTAKDTQSGLAKKDTYKYYLIDGEVSDLEQVNAQKGSAKETSINSSYTFTKLKENRKYTLVVDVSDEVGNVTTDFKAIQAIKIPDLDQAEITFGYSNDNWNNEEKIHVTISTGKDVDTKNYDLQYQTPEEENKDWQNYIDAGFDITKNGSIFARLKEKDGDQVSKTTASSSYTKFDREQPELSEIEVTDTTTNSISVSVTATDKPDQGASGLLEENAYTYMIDTTENMSKISNGVIIMGEPMGASETLVTESLNEPTHTFTGLTHGTDYTIKVMVMDKAQNIAEQETTQTTEKIPDISQEGELTFDVTPKGWTNKDQATVRINTKEELSSNLKIQYQTLAEENTDWQDYSKDAGFTITKNGTINAKILEINGEQTSSIATLNYNYFDRKNPEVTIEADEPTVTSVNVRITDSKDEESAPGAKDNSGLDDEERYSYWLEEVDGDPKDSPVWIGTEENHNYEGLLQGKKYNLKVEAKDKAGNKGTSNVATITTKTIPDLNEEGALEVTYEPEAWTNAESVKVTLKSKYTDQGYKLRYSTNYEDDVPEWKEYTDEGFEITKNQKFAVKLELKGPEGTASQYGKVAIKEVTWIDRDVPELEITGEPEKTTNSITVNVTASDALSQLKDENPITYYLLDGEVTDPEQIKTQKAEAENQTATSETSHQFTDLTQATTYTVVVDAEDKAGNIATQSKVITTEKVPDLSYGTDITYTYSSETWTNTPPVTVTLNPQNNIDEGFTLQYGTSTTAEEPTVWNDYNLSPFEQNENCTIYTRLKETDGDQVGKSAQSEMKLIDTEESTGTLKVSSYSTNSLSVEVENPGDTLSGLHKTETYEYSIYQGDSAEGVAKETKSASTEATAQFTGLTQNTEYTVKVVIKDNAGNTHESTVTQTIKEVPSLSAGDITFDYDTKTWTNKASVKVTLSAKDTVDLDTYKLQYQTPAETDNEWQDYPEGDTGFTITENGSIYARLIEKEGTQTGGTATGTYSWFDRQAPTAAIKVTGTTNSNTINVSAEGTTDTVGELTATPYVFSIYQGATAEGSAKETKPAQATNTTSFSGLTHGTQYTIKVEVTDKATNTGSNTVTQATVAIPNLSTSGFTFNYTPNGPTWTNTDVTVKANPDYLSDENFKLQMKSDSKSSYVDYTSEGFKISTNEKVYAQLVEKNGTQRGVEATGQVTWIDKQAPTVDPLSTDTNVTVGETTIDITNLNATDTASGIESFLYYIRSHSDAEWSSESAEGMNWENAVGSPSPVTGSFRFTKLADGTAYDIMVKVSDNAGTETIVKLNNITTKEIKPKQGSELSIGQYVKYEPSGGSTTYPSEQEHNGKELQNIDRETLNWRVLSVDGNTVKIISDQTTKSVTYQGPEGYNNAVKDLNDMCETLYSHDTTKARSVNLDDFTTSQWKSGFTQSSGSPTPSNGTYPTIYQYESNGSLRQSQQTQWYSGTYDGSSAKTNYWNGNIPSGTPLYGVGYYWLSSRCVSSDNWYAWFDLAIAYASLFYVNLYTTNHPTSYGSEELSIRAVVSLPESCRYKQNGDASLVWYPLTIIW